jgi:hypothetical protein
MRGEREDAIKSSTDFNDRIVYNTRIKYNSNAYTWREWNKTYGMGDRGVEGWKIFLPI